MLIGPRPIPDLRTILPVNLSLLGWKGGMTPISRGRVALPVPLERSKVLSKRTL